MLVESINPRERDQLLAIATRTRLFSQEDADSLLGGVLDRLAAFDLPEGHQAASCRQTQYEPVIGWCYFAPDDHAAGVWNIWWIGVEPEKHGGGAGKALLKYAEGKAASAGGRLLVIETNDTETTARARRFYARSGYSECGRIPDFYADGEAKIIFARHLPSVA